MSVEHLHLKLSPPVEKFSKALLLKVLVLEFESSSTVNSWFCLCRLVEVLQLEPSLQFYNKSWVPFQAVGRVEGLQL